MNNGSKYDILERKYKTNSILALNLVLKLFNIKEKMKTKNLNRSNDKIVNLLNEVLPVVITFANIGYENVKDLGSSVSKEELTTYLKKENIDPVEFSSNYLKNINKYTKLLLIFAIIAKDKSALPNLRNPQTALNLLGGDEINDSIFDDLFANLSIESINLIKEVLTEEFSIDQMTNYQRELLEEYHYKYMSQNIYNQITSEQEKPQIVMKLANSYAKKTKF